MFSLFSRKVAQIKCETLLEILNKLSLYMQVLFYDLRFTFVKISGNGSGRGHRLVVIKFIKIFVIMSTEKYSLINYVSMLVMH